MTITMAVAEVEDMEAAADLAEVTTCVMFDTNQMCFIWANGFYSLVCFRRRRIWR